MELSLALLSDYSLVGIVVEGYGHFYTAVDLRMEKL